MARWSASTVILLVSFFSIAVSQDAETVRRFLTWCKKNGIRGKVSIINYDKDNEERGLMAVKDIKKDDVIVSIPFNASIVLSDDDPVPFEGSGDHMRLMSLLLREVEKGESSFWAPYLAMLPSLPPVPWLALPPSQYSQYHHSPTIRRIQAMADYYEGVWGLCDEEIIGHADLHRFKWGMAMLYARRFTTAIPTEDGGEKTLELFLPFGDLLNHHQRYKGDMGDADWGDGLHADRLDLIAFRDVKAGQQLFESYMHESAEEFVLSQGFLPRDHPMKTAVIFESLEEGVVWLLRYLQQQQQQQQDAGLPPPKLLFGPSLYTRALEAANEASERAMGSADKDWREDENSGTYEIPGAFGIDEKKGYIKIGYSWEGSERIVVALSAALRAAIHGVSEVSNGGGGGYSERDAHKVVAAALVRRCQELLESFPTSAEEDEELLEKGFPEGCSEFASDCKEGGEGKKVPLSEAMQLAVRYRLMIKKLLAQLAEKEVTEEQVAWAAAAAFGSSRTAAQ